MLGHLIQETPDWKAGRRQLDEFFPSPEGDEKQRKRALMDALNLAQKGKVRAGLGTALPSLQQSLPLTPRSSTRCRAQMQQVAPLLKRHTVGLLQVSLTHRLMCCTPTPCVRLVMEINPSATPALCPYLPFPDCDTGLSQQLLGYLQ